MAIVISVGIFLLVILGVIALGVATDWGTKGRPNLPEYDVVENKVYDVPVKSQVTMHVVLKDSTISHDQLVYLTEILASSCQSQKVKFHGGKPTHVFVYIHNSKSSYDSGIWTSIPARYAKIGEADTGSFFYSQE